MLTRFMKNRKGTAEIIGSVMFIVILLFFFSNIYLWHDQATSQMNTLYSQRMNSPVSLTATNDGVVVTNNGGVDMGLSRLWIYDPAGHFYADLGNIAGTGLWIKSGSSIGLNFQSLGSQWSKTSPIAVTPPGSQTNATIQYGPPATGTVTLKILTTLGNTATCSYPFSSSQQLGGGGDGGNNSVSQFIGSLVLNFTNLVYYNVSQWSNNTYYLSNFQQGQGGANGYFVNEVQGNQQIGIAFGVTLTNLDPQGRNVTLFSQSVLFSLLSTTKPGNGPLANLWYIIGLDKSGNIINSYTSFTPVPVPYGNTTTIYFAAASTGTGNTGFIPQSSYFKNYPAIAPINLALIGTIGTSAGATAFGQNIPFVTIDFNN